MCMAGLCITSSVLSDFGFSNLVVFLYPAFGYLGAIQLAIIFLSKNLKK